MMELAKVDERGDNFEEGITSAFIDGKSQPLQH
jgi:hypothetical protein